MNFSMYFRAKEENCRVSIVIWTIGMDENQIICLILWRVKNRMLWTVRTLKADWKADGVILSVAGEEEGCLLLYIVMDFLE